MHLHEARLCLDCEELHTLDRCPLCASDAFSFVTRWIPASEQRRLRPVVPPTRSHRARWVTGAISMVVFAVARQWKPPQPDRRRLNVHAPAAPNDDHAI
jgi:hypothetical protein